MVLSIHCTPDHPMLPAYVECLKVLLARQVQPLRSIGVKTINGSNAATSPYCAALAEGFHAIRNAGGVRLSRRF